MSRNRRWTSDENAKLIKLREVDEFNWEEIGAALGIEASRCRSQYHSISSRGGSPDRPGVAKASVELLQESARREEARHTRDGEALKRGICNQVCFSDPPPGYSALDRKNSNPQWRLPSVSAIVGSQRGAP